MKRCVTWCGPAAAKRDQVRARHRLGKFLLRCGLRPGPDVRPWTGRHLAWIRAQTFGYTAQEVTFLDYLHEVEHVADRVAHLAHAIEAAIVAAEPTQQAVIAGLQALRGVSQLTAVTLVAEVGVFSRFARPKQLMGYSGMVSREDSSGARVRRGAITKTGNAHLRRIVGEAAWTARYRPAVSPILKRRQAGVAPEVTAIAWRAQRRLHDRYRRLLGRGKVKQQVITAVGREMLGFIWAIAVHIERARAAAACAA
jgi:transposase